MEVNTFGERRVHEKDKRYNRDKKGMVQQSSDKTIIVSFVY